MKASLAPVFAEGRKDAVSAPENQCGVCLEAMSKYTCPRCNLCYCSLGCFKAQKHAGCSESFYKDCFVEEMKNSQVSNEEKLRIMKMLKNFEDGVAQEEYASEEITLEDRLKDIDLDDTDEVWSVLNSEEREEFRKTMLSGSLIKEWKPWWIFHDMALITEIGDDMKDTNSSDFSPQPPTEAMDVPELPILLHGKQSSPLVRNNLVDILYCYAYHCHRYNGNLTDFGSEAARGIILASPFLHLGVTANTVDEAIQTAMENCSKSGGESFERVMLIEAVLDIYHILLGHDKDNTDTYVSLSLRELHSCCKALKDHLKKHKEKAMSGKNVLRTMKKIEFMLSWSKYKKSDLLPLAVEVLKIYKNRASFAEENKRTAETLKKAKSAVNTERPAYLIEEID